MEIGIIFVLISLAMLLAICLSYFYAEWKRENNDRRYWQHTAESQETANHSLRAESSSLREQVQALELKLAAPQKLPPIIRISKSKKKSKA